MTDAALRTDLDHTAHTFLGYTDDAKRREKVDAHLLPQSDVEAAEQVAALLA